ncbi:MAG: acylphosphatase [Candidatus Marinimicrobia bacterium]|jgi:acylphosphatase|nr:acylphosphatase [Candidatus Neomarinimicrobiota bacterium]|tara:strand:+ start:1811 stop:2083 length:273 start_codon:yes stop_codon:yes gene_type:complete
MRVLKAKVYGKVQGVWFRKYTLDSARDIGVVGMVKNLVDGTVLVNASGKNENLREFKELLENGSTNSRVDKIDYSWEDLSIEYSTFEIEY